MNQWASRARALITMVLVVVMVLVVGTVAMVLGLIHPFRTFMDVSSRAWAGVILFCSGVRLQLEGPGFLGDGKPRFYVGNHQSALDIPILLWILKGNVRFMAKESLFRLPILGWVIRRYGYIPVHRNSPRRTLRTIQAMMERIRRQPVSLAVFPEGTRSDDGRLLPFRRGAIKIVQQTGLDVVPFCMDDSWAIHQRKTFRLKPGTVRLSWGAPIPAAEAASLSPDELAQRIVSFIASRLGPLDDPSLPNAAARLAVAGLEKVQ